MRSNQKNFLILLLLVAGLFFIYQNFLDNSSRSKGVQLDYTSFQEAVSSNQIQDVEMRGDTVTGHKKDGTPFTTKLPENTEVANALASKGIKVQAKSRDDERSTLWSILISWFPTLLFIGVWVYFYRQMQGGGGKALGFGKSKAKMLIQKSGKITFKDVAGITESKQEVEEVVEFLRDPQKFQRLGGKIPKGVLLIGSPGNGKTLLARAIAGEANVPFFSISGSDFVEMFVGVGASRVRDMFEQAKKHAPCILFIDEIDAVGRHRGAGLGGGHDEREQTLNALLVEMDGFEPNTNIIVLAATNRPDVLDTALVRPGRFDRQVVVDAPDLRGRHGILKVHTRKIPMKDVNLETIAKGTPGLVGADLENIVNEAALLAARKEKSNVNMDDFEEAKDKVMMGVERKSMLLSDDEKELTAYHESGHALVAKLLPDADPIHKVTIIPRGRALGLTSQLPIDERHNYPKSYIETRLKVLMGGRVAEQIIFGELTTGGGNDIEVASEVARKMVCEWGMSKVMGPLTFGKKEQEIFLGREIAQHRDYSELTAQKIDEEVTKIVTEAEKVVMKLLKNNIDKLHSLAKVLLEYETINGADIDDILAGVKLKRRPARENNGQTVEEESIPETVEETEPEEEEKKAE